MSFAENRGIWFAVAAIALVAALIFWLLAGAQPFRLVILFDDIGGLKKEDPVVWKNFEIGKVEEIRPLVENRIGVTIRIREDYVASIGRGSEFRLKRAGFLGLIGRDAIEVTTPAAPGPAFAPGEKVFGISGPKPSLLREGRELGIQYWNQLREETSRLVGDFNSSPYRKDLEETADRLQQLAGEGARQAADEIGRFAQNHRKEMESALQSLKALRDKLLKAGDRPGAGRIEKQIEKVEEGIRP